MKAHKCDGCQNLLSFRNGYAKCIYCGCEYGEKRKAVDPDAVLDDVSFYSTCGNVNTYTRTLYPSSSTTMYIGGPFTTGYEVRISYGTGYHTIPVYDSP